MVQNIRTLSLTYPMKATLYMFSESFRAVFHEPQPVTPVCFSFSGTPKRRFSPEKRLERATEVLELTYLGKYFACVNTAQDKCIRLRSHRISHPVLSGSRRSHSITFSKVRLHIPDILKFSFHHSTKFPFNRVLNQNLSLGHDHARLTRLVLRKAICSRINCFRLVLQK